MITGSNRQVPEPIKTPPDVTSPTSGTHFNMRAIKECVRREIDPLEFTNQPSYSPPHEDSASTCSFLTVSGSSGYFSKAYCAEGSNSPKFSPSTESLHHKDDEDGQNKSVTFSHLRLGKFQGNQPPDPNFIPTRFSFITKEYLPRNLIGTTGTGGSSLFKNACASLPTSPIEVTPVKTPVSTTPSSDSHNTVVTSVAARAASAEPSLPRSKYFPFLNVNHSYQDEPCSPTSDRSTLSGESP